MRTLKLGSLFDGSGGFPLAGVLHGIEPVWASEIEPFPIRVTKARFQNMKHLGSVTDINGAEIEPVDIITFGSPCQDLSVAGKQLGIHEGQRSNLFFEAIRIIKEMREHDRAIGWADNDVRPRFAVWENVPGAFSSNKGRDFQAVLQALCGIRGGQDHIVPMPPKGKWLPSGCIVGNGWSVAWRVYDAQFWGVPQRRKRIYLIADFGSERAGEILFERESGGGDSAQGGEAGKGTADHAERSAGGSDRVECLNPWDSQSIRQYSADGIWPSLQANSGGGQNRSGICVPVYPINTMVATRSGKDDMRTCFGIGEPNDPQFTLSAAHEHAVCYPNIARSLCARFNSSPCVDRGMNVIAIDCRNMCANEELSGTIQAKNQGGHSLNYINPVCYPIENHPADSRIDLLGGGRTSSDINKPDGDGRRERTDGID